MGIKEHASSAPGHEPMHWSTLHEAAEQTGMAYNVLECSWFQTARGSRNQDSALGFGRTANIRPPSSFVGNKAPVIAIPGHEPRKATIHEPAEQTSMAALLGVLMWLDYSRLATRTVHQREGLPDYWPTACQSNVEFYMPCMPVSQGLHIQGQRVRLRARTGNACTPCLTDCSSCSGEADQVAATAGATMQPGMVIRATGKKPKYMVPQAEL